jgi:putative NAD(P)-binding protein
MDEGNEQSFRKCVRHLFGDAAGQRRTALLQKRRHSRDGAGFQSHICIQKDQNGVRGEPGEHIASVLFSTPAWGKRRGGFDAHASIRAGDRANNFRRLIGRCAGPGGLAAAILLAAAGLRVKVIERLGVVGVRTSAIAARGFKLDLGPTFFLFPRVLEEIFAAAGASLRSEVEMVRLDPVSDCIRRRRRAVCDSGGLAGGGSDCAAESAGRGRVSTVPE